MEGLAIWVLATVSWILLINHKLIITMAKISTFGDFVEDSFHLRNEFGFKISDNLFIEKLKKEIKFFLRKEGEKVA